MYAKLNESGRSMIEMLGVLAVIGVLSVAGIMGYKYGMMKYRVNETVNELNMMANTYGIQMQQMTEEQTMPTNGELLSEEGATTRMGYGYEVLGFNNHFEIALLNIPTEECEQLQKTGWAMPYDIQVAEITTENCGEIVYYINNDLSGFAPETDNSDEDDTDEEETPEIPPVCIYGALENGKCKCYDGYAGDTCEQCDASKGYKRMDSNGKCYLDCEKTKTCTQENFCNGKSSLVYEWDGRAYCEYCQAGYWGTHCENYDPSGDACNGRTKYIHAWINKPHATGCNCKAEYWGKFCEYENTTETPTCNGHGVLHYGTCVCDSGYSGEFCEIEEDENCGIVINEYYNGRTGYVTYDNGKRICHCMNGYTGPDCKTPPTGTCYNWDYSQDENNPTCR